MPNRTSSIDWATVPMSPQARAFCDNVFLPRYKQLLDEGRKTPLAILVWGPGPGGGDLYEKRLQIRAQLRTWGHAALFSEEIGVQHARANSSAKTRESLQAMAADFIVVLQDSPGSTAEVHDLAEFIQEIGPKMLIFIDERAQEGYSYTGALQELNTLYHNVETYKYPRDIEECLLIRAVQEKTEVLRWAKWRRSLR